MLEIWLTEKPPEYLPYEEARQYRLYRHESSETYRRHSEARAWISRTCGYGNQYRKEISRCRDDDEIDRSNARRSR